MPEAKLEDFSEIVQRLDAIATRLDVVINLLLDLLPDDRFSEPRKLTHKVARLDSTGIELRPADIGKMLGRPSKDISSRRREYKATFKKRQKRLEGQGNTQLKSVELSER